MNVSSYICVLLEWQIAFTCRPKRTLNSKKYGVDLIRYTHAANTAIHSSTKVDGIVIVYSCFVVK